MSISISTDNEITRLRNLLQKIERITKNIYTLVGIPDIPYKEGIENIPKNLIHIRNEINQANTDILYNNKQIKNITKETIEVLSENAFEDISRLFE